MNKLTLASSALACLGGLAHAGEIERQGDPTKILFEKGKNYLEFYLSTVDPSISGDNTLPLPLASTGDISERFQSFGLGYKHQLNDKVALALVLNQPVGTDVQYQSGTGAFFEGSSAIVDSKALTGLAKYQATERISVYGGLRLEALSGDITINAPLSGIDFGFPNPDLNYTLSVDSDYKLGYIAGAAYEIPNIALRVALTYESKITHDFRDNNGAKFDVEIPQAVTLNAQTGIAKDTLLFGSARWREWTKFDVTPLDFFNQSGGDSIASGPSDIITYTLGVGHKFSENWSSAFVLGYEKDQGDVVGNLSGKDGYISYGLAATYETESWEITSAVQYFDIGGAETSLASFSGSDALAFGMKMGFRF